MPAPPARLPAEPDAAIATVPPGRWAVAVSGGADSVALLELLQSHAALTLHIVHLDHETRAGASAADAAFVRALADRYAIECTIERRSTIEAAGIASALPRNASARYRAARFELFRQAIARHALAGVILAHHADDQAETVLQRLLRGSGPAGLGGMRPRAVVGGVTVLRPLLGVPRRALREVLASRGIAWREDASNRSPLQQRNRVRAMLEAHPQLTGPVIELGEACAALTTWLRAQGPPPQATLDVRAIQRLPAPVAREAARAWLAARAGAGRREIPPAAVERLLTMAADAASPPRQHFPGGLLVRRRTGQLVAEPPIA